MSTCGFAFVGSVNARAVGVVLSLGALGGLAYQGLTYAEHGPIRIPIPAWLAIAALCAGLALLIATIRIKPTA